MPGLGCTAGHPPNTPENTSRDSHADECHLPSHPGVLAGLEATGLAEAPQSSGGERGPQGPKQSRVRAQLQAARGERRWDIPLGTDHGSCLGPSALRALPQTSDRPASEPDHGTAQHREVTAGNLRAGRSPPRARHAAAPAVHGEAILSAGHGPALDDDSRDGTPSQSVTGQEMLPQLPADVSL